ncbi:C1 family peptidase [Pseudoteredinibacter isoporae]|uniref:C1 family peptidase n=1 Tax=Pseudoteredinibacter isoporae TaxID=570281 RepID=UPI00310A054A
MPKLSNLTLNVTSDAPDFRDRYYEPTLAPLRTTFHPPGNLFILDQGSEGACTGFGLAAAINLLYRQRDDEHKVSARMLYEMARRYDEWAGEDYEGSSCRGAIKGWKNTGVCSDTLCPYRPKSRFRITPEISADAKSRTLGAYYRLRPVVSDWHAAINEAGVVYASAQVHSGWSSPVKDSDNEAVIPHRDMLEGGHAFAVVGYNAKGFWVQNSWGDEWGDDGLALWLYEDWANNVMDGWVIQLALPTPQVFDLGLNAGAASSANNRAEKGAPARFAIEEHFVHLDDGKYHDSGRYWSNKDHMSVVQSALANSGCQHLLLYAHGGLNSTKASATRIAAMKPVFLANGIYPFHFMYDTGLLEELKDVIFGKSRRAERVTGGVRDWFDRRIENATRKPGRALWREMKFGAEAPFRRTSDDGTDVLERLLSSLPQGMQIHVVGHSTGAILHAHLLARLAQIDPAQQVSTCALLAPAATNALFEAKYRPLLEAGLIGQLNIYNLTDKLERDDTVAKIYGKSLLYLVSRAFEERYKAPILGMEKYNKQIDGKGHPLEFVYARSTDRGRSRSDTHGGFDNDPATMNDVLKQILGGSPDRPFKKSDLEY